MYKVAITGNTYSNTPLEECLSDLGELGFDGIELLLERPHIFLGDPPKFSEFDAKARKNLKERLDSLGLGISALDALHIITPPDPEVAKLSPWTQMIIVGGEPTFTSLYEGVRRTRIEYTKRCIDLAVDLEADNVLVASGTCYTAPPDAWRLWLEGLGECIDYAADRHVHLAVEMAPAPHRVCENPDDFLRTQEKINSRWLGLNMDIGHVYAADKPIGDSIRRTAKYILHTHFEDMADGRHFHLVPGLGEIKFKEAIDTLESVGYKGYLCLELYNDFRNPKAAAKQGLEYLRKIQQ